MAASSIAAFWVVALLLIIVPGADWAFTISAGLHGHSILAAVSGLVLGYAAMTIVVAAGVGALVARSPAFLTGLTIAGGLYLMWHGARALARPSAPGTPSGAPASTNRATLVKGVGVSGLNPKGLLVFLALLPQFTNPHWAGPSRSSSAFSDWPSRSPAQCPTSASGLPPGRSCTPAPPPRVPSPGSPEPR